MFPLTPDGKIFSEPGSGDIMITFFSLFFAIWAGFCLVFVWNGCLVFWACFPKINRRVGLEFIYFIWLNAPFQLVGL